MSWAHVAPAVTAAFLASIVEFVEALTVILTVGSGRGWRGALTGAGAAPMASNARQSANWAKPSCSCVSASARDWAAAFA